MERREREISPPAPPEYRYLEATDLTDEMIQETLTTYSEEADTYAEMEWSDYMVDKVWEIVFSVLRDEIDNLTSKDEVLVAGCGSFRDLLVLALMNGRARIFGYDIATGMLEEGQKRLNWENISKMAAKIKVFETQESFAWINELIDVIDALANKVELPKIAKLAESAVVEKMLELIQFALGDLRTFHIPGAEYKMIFAPASLPHIKKIDVPDSLLLMLDMLKDGGTFYFNLRVDNSGAEHGRIFMDTVLGQRRYFTTYSPREIHMLVDWLQTSVPGIDIEMMDNSAHPDLNKPGFHNLVIRKRSTPLLPAELTLAAA